MLFSKLPWVLKPELIVSMRQDAMLVLYVDANAYERMDRVASFAFALLRRCAGNVAQVVNALGTAF